MRITFVAKQIKMMGISHEITQSVTAEQLRNSSNVKLRTWQARWKKRIGTPYEMDMPLTDDQVALMTGSEKPMAPKRIPAPVKTRQEIYQPVENIQETTTQEIISSTQARALFNWFCALGVIAHTILVWYDCANLWGVPGFIGGCVSFLLICAAVLLSLTPRKETAKISVAIAIVVDVLAVFVHYPTFIQHGNIDPEISLGFSIFLCAGSASLIYLFNHEKHGK